MGAAMAAVTIVGGGISGLSAAYELHRRGLPFSLHEASPRLGGIVRTDYADGLVIDIGPDGMLARKPAGVQLCEELHIAQRLVPTNPPRTAFLVRDGALAPLTGPPQAVASTTGAHVSEDESIARHFKRRYGPEAVDYYAEPLLAVIHAGDVDKLSMHALFPELIDQPPGGRGVDPQGVFRSFPRGMQELIDALASALPPAALHTNSPIASVDEHLANGPVILAVPAQAAADLLQPLDAELASLCRGIRYVSSGIVIAAYPRDAVEHPLNGSGFIVPRAERATRILAATWLSSKWPGRAPEGVALMRAFFGGVRDPEAMSLDDDRLVEMAHADLSRLLGISAQPTFARVHKWFETTPQYEVGYLERLSAIHARLARHRGLFLAGAGFGSIGIPDCIAAGRTTAARASQIIW